MFGEALQLDLDLAIEKDRFQISGESIKNFELSLSSYGFEAKADFSISFGKMVWPHMLVRVMLAEQIYRAATILSGSPYHRT